MTDVELAAEHLRMSVLSANALGVDRCAVMVDELAALLDDHGRLRAIEEHDRSAARHVAAEWGNRGQCEDCSCCDASGCRVGLGSTCPTDQLGESVCPCTGD